jgi:hypothetical protein
LHELYIYIYIYIYIYTHTHTPKSLTSVGCVAALLRFIDNVSNLPLLTIAGYDFYNSHDKLMKRKMVTGKGCGMGIGGCNSLYSVTTTLSLVALFFMSVSIGDRPLHWTLVKS